MTASRGENQMGIPMGPMESHVDGNHWAKLLGMRMGVGMSQRELEEMGISFFS